MTGSGHDPDQGDLSALRAVLEAARTAGEGRGRPGAVTAAPPNGGRMRALKSLTLTIGTGAFALAVLAFLLAIAHGQGYGPTYDAPWSRDGWQMHLGRPYTDWQEHADGRLTLTRDGNRYTLTPELLVITTADSSLCYRLSRYRGGYPLAIERTDSRPGTWRCTISPNTSAP
jgi:hypothetical protein